MPQGKTYCHMGTGELRHNVTDRAALQAEWGTMNYCHTCHGWGTTIKKSILVTCPRCKGKGREPVPEAKKGTLTHSDIQILFLSLVGSPVMLRDGRLIKRELAGVEDSCDNCAIRIDELFCPLQGACCPKGPLLYIFVEVEP